MVFTCIFYVCFHAYICLLYTFSCSIISNRHLPHCTGCANLIYRNILNRVESLSIVLGWMSILCARISGSAADSGPIKVYHVGPPSQPYPAIILFFAIILTLTPLPSTHLPTRTQNTHTQVAKICKKVIFALNLRYTQGCFLYLMLVMMWFFYSFQWPFTGYKARSWIDGSPSCVACSWVCVRGAWSLPSPIHYIYCSISIPTQLIMGWKMR